MDKRVFYVRDALFDELEARVRVKARFIFGQYEYVERIALRRRLLDKIKVAVSERVAVDDGRADDAARALQQKLEKAGIRTEIDLRNEKIGFKVREAVMMKIPYMLVMGDKEVEEGTVNVRTRKGEVITETVTVDKEECYEVLSVEPKVVTGVPIDLVRAIGTFFFLWLGAEPMLEKLDRVKTKYGLAE